VCRGFDAVAVLVHQAVMAAAERAQVGEPRGAAARPGEDVVRVGEAVRAAREAAAVVAQAQRAAERCRDAARAA